MEKNVTKTILGQSFNFIVSTSMSINDEAVHINVRISPGQEDSFRNIPNNSGYLESIANETARNFKRRANLMFTQVNTGTEWQGQFDF